MVCLGKKQGVKVSLFFFFFTFILASLSPERAEDSDALTAVSSQLEGSPMDTSSLASGPLEEGVGEASGVVNPEQPLVVTSSIAVGQQPLDPPTSSESQAAVSQISDER